MKHHFPLATRWATDLIAAILPPSRVTNLDVRHLHPIAGLLYRAHMLAGESLNAMHIRVRATYKILERGFDAHPQSMSGIYDKAFTQLDALQQRESALARAAWNASTQQPDDRFGSLLSLYQFTYESYYRTLAAPVVAADALSRTKQPLTDVIDSDGRVKVRVMAEIEAGQRLKAGLLTNGLDNHLRNASAHHHYHILSDTSIELWDANPRTGAYSWGPVRLSHAELSRRVYALTVTCCVLLLALALFDIAYGRTMRARGWSTLGPQRPRRDIALAEMVDAGALHGFDVIKVDFAGGDAIEVVLRVLDETAIDQTSEIRTSTGARYAREIRTHHAPLRQQAYGFIQMSHGTHIAFATLRLRIVGRDGQESFGEIAVDRKAREAILTGETTIDEVGSLVAVDTLPDRMIPVVHTGIPLRIR